MKEQGRQVWTLTICGIICIVAVHMQDPLVKQATLEQYRSRSAYKLIELDDKFHFLQKGSIVVSIFYERIVHTAIVHK